MFTAPRNRFRKRPEPRFISTGKPPARSPDEEAEAQAKAEARAYAETVKTYLGLLSEEERTEYIAAAKDFADAVDETGARSIHACYRGGDPEIGNTPEGIRSVEEMGYLTSLLRSIPSKESPENGQNANSTPIT